MADIGILLYYNRTFADTSVVIGEEQIRVHACVAAARSEYFRALLSNGMRESETRTIVLDMHPKVVKRAIKFIYVGQLKIGCAEEGLALMHASNFLGIRAMEEACASWLLANVTADSCILTWGVAAELNNVALRQYAEYVIGRDLEDVLATDAFLALSGAELALLLSSDHLGVNAEHETVAAIVAWARHGAREGEVRSIVASVRTSLIPRAVLSVLSERIPALGGVSAHPRRDERERNHAWSGALVTTGGGNPSEGALPTTVGSITLPRNTNAVGTEFTAARFGGTVLVLGGYIATPTGNFNRASEAAEVFCKHAMRWVPVAPCPSPRRHPAAVSLGRRVYFLGGYGGTKSLDSALVFDGAWHKAPPMHDRRAGCAAASCGAVIYAAGGTDGAATLRSAEAYDTQKEAWARIPDMAFARRAAAAASDGRYVYVVGGRAGDGDLLRSAERYDTATEEWTSIACMRTPRAACAATFVDGRLCVFGGTVGFFATDSVESYDPDRDRWIQEAAMPQQREAHCVFVM